MLQYPKVQIPEGAKCVDGKCVDVHCHATMQHPLSPFLGILFKHLVPQNPTIIDTVYCCVLVLTVFQSGYMRINKKFQHHFPCWWLSSELSFDGPCHRFPFHSLAFTLWLTVVHPHIPTGNAYQECLNLKARVMPKALAECQMVAFVLSYNVKLNPGLPWQRLRSARRRLFLPANWT